MDIDTSVCILRKRLPLKPALNHAPSRLRPLSASRAPGVSERMYGFTDALLVGPCLALAHTPDVTGPFPRAPDTRTPSGAFSQSSGIHTVNTWPGRGRGSDSGGRVDITQSARSGEKHTEGPGHDRVGFNDKFEHFLCVIHERYSESKTGRYGRETREGSQPTTAG